MRGRSESIHTSLRAQRSNPESFRGDSLDCFAALAMTEDGGLSASPILTAHAQTAPHLNSGVPGTKASKAAQNWER